MIEVLRAAVIGAGSATAGVQEPPAVMREFCVVTHSYRGCGHSVRAAAITLDPA